jgi:hypothetical protein
MPWITHLRCISHKTGGKRALLPNAEPVESAETRILRGIQRVLSRFILHIIWLTMTSAHYAPNDGHLLLEGAIICNAHPAIIAHWPPA